MMGAYAAPRVGGWFSWGDFAQLPYRTTCGNVNCCNPLHLRVLEVPHFYHNRKLDLIDFNFSSRKLHSHVVDFLDTTRNRRPGLYGRLRRDNPEWIEKNLAESLEEEAQVL
jgi:hypothetical protein